MALGSGAMLGDRPVAAVSLRTLRGIAFCTAEQLMPLTNLLCRWVPS
jgi:hypothetical protein